MEGGRGRPYEIASAPADSLSGRAGYFMSMATWGSLSVLDQEEHWFVGRFASFRSPWRCYRLAVDLHDDMFGLMPAEAAGELVPWRSPGRPVILRP